MAYKIMKGQANQTEKRGVLASSTHYGTTHVQIDASVARDAVGGHTPDTYLREGLILTKISANGMYAHFDSAAIDGRQLPVSAVVLAHDVDVLDAQEDPIVSVYHYGVFYENLLLVGAGFSYTNCQRLQLLQGG